MFIILIAFLFTAALIASIFVAPGFAARHGSVRVVHLVAGEESETTNVEARREAVLSHFKGFTNPAELRIYGTRRALLRIGCTGPHYDIRGKHFDFEWPVNPDTTGWTYAYVEEAS